MPAAEAGRLIPEGTFAANFHFPKGGDWRDVPKPSRAEQVLRAVGLLPRQTEAEDEKEGIPMPED